MTARRREREPAPGSTSRSLIEGVRAHDADAWRRLVSLYAPLVMQWCRRSPLPPDDVGDVFQEVFQAAATRIESFRRHGAGDTFRGWLRTITTNKIHDVFRRRGREARGVGGSEMGRWLGNQPAPEPVGAEDAERAATDTEFAQLLRRGLRQIRDQFRDNTWLAFWRTTVDGRSPQDVGDELGMTAGAVRVAKSRVLQRLRAELGDAE